MKNRITLILAVILAACSSTTSKIDDKITAMLDVSKLTTSENTGSNSGPGLGIDPESLKDNLDLNMDISNLSLSDIRILRNALYARQGYCFMKAELRAVFSTTSWYDKVMEDRFWAFEEGNPLPPISLTREEQAFVDRLLVREKELKKQNFLKSEDQVYPNLNNLVNLFQMKDISPELLKKLAQYGFAIVPGNEIQLFHVYEQNDYRQFPNFVTTDMYLQLMHMYFGFVLRTLEEEQFIPTLAVIVRSMMEEMKHIAETDPDASVRELANYNITYYAIALSILKDEKIAVPSPYESMYQEEIGHITDARDDVSDFLDYKNVEFPYSLFKPRGHYTRTENLKRYFKAMMWLQTAPFCLDNEVHLKRALLSVGVLAGTSDKGRSIRMQYKAILEPVSFLIGEPDNVSFYQLARLLEEEGISATDILADEEVFRDFRSRVKLLADTQNRIRPKHPVSCVDKINFMPQRYLADNEVLQELVDVESLETKRGYPKGLDIMAAFGSASAEDILLNELREGEKWKKYPELLAEMKTKMKEVDWDATVYNKWIESLLNMQKSDKDYPYFMQSPAWAKKDLNASLASWAELKHDAILYAEQPMAAECGGGGPPDPYTVGYVEPNVKYWTTAIEMVDLTLRVLKENHLESPEVERVSQRLKDNAEFLLSASKKELAGEKLSEQEYREIEYIGSTFEWITLDLVKQKDQYLDGWHNVQGPDRSVAVVADVFTSNALNNDDPGVLHEATGNVNDIYVVVEIEGYLYLTRGAVLEYREFHLPPGNRLTDEEWQEMLKKNQAEGVPEWMKEIIVPIKRPELNQKIFYSSGC